MLANNGTGRDLSSSKKKRAPPYLHILHSVENQLWHNRVSAYTYTYSVPSFLPLCKIAHLALWLSKSENIPSITPNRKWFVIGSFVGSLCTTIEIHNDFRSMDAESYPSSRPIMIRLLNRYTNYMIPFFFSDFFHNNYKSKISKLSTSGVIWQRQHYICRLMMPCAHRSSNYYIQFSEEESKTVLPTVAGPQYGVETNRNVVKLLKNLLNYKKSC